MENWGDHQEKKFYMDNAVHALHLFKEGHQILLKLHVHLGEGVILWENKEGIFSKMKKCCMVRLFRIY